MVPFGEGHINPALGLAQELKRRGDEIVVYAANAYRDRVEALGAAFRRLPLRIDPAAVGRWLQKPEPLPEIQMQTRMLRYVLETLPDMLAWAQSDRLDYLMCDSVRGWLGATAARRLGMPHGSLCTTFAWVPGAPRVFAPMWADFPPDPALVREHR